MAWLIHILVRNGICFSLFYWSIINMDVDNFRLTNKSPNVRIGHNFYWTLQRTLHATFLVPSFAWNHSLCPSVHKPLTQKSPPPQSGITAWRLPLSCTPRSWCGWDLPRDITSLLKRPAQRSRCLLCENTPVAWPDPDNDPTITQLSHPGGGQCWEGGVPEKELGV